ncbi:MAG: hypothetical protein R3D52_12105 [Xanthobacteraceae bacterium]
MAFLVLFFVLLVGLPVLAAATQAQGVKLFDAFYRAGSLEFGAATSLPLLQASVVPPGWVGNDTFLAGYGGVGGAWTSCSPSPLISAR